MRDLRLRSPISKDLYGSNTGLRLSMIISFRILDLVIIKTKLRDSEGISTYLFLMIFYGPVKETRRIISSFGLTIRRIGIWTVIDVGTLVRFDWDFGRGNVVGSFNFRRFGFTEVLDLGSSDQYKWRLVFTLWSITLISSFSSYYAKHQSWVFVLFSIRRVN